MAERRRSLRALDALNFCIAGIDGSATVITIYYATDRHPNPGQIGLHRASRVWPSKQFRREFGHTPVSVADEIPWDCKRLVIGTGGGALPVMDQLSRRPSTGESS